MSKKNQISGKFIGNERGFGFVLRENGEDIFVPPHATNGALNGDEVSVRIKKTEGGSRKTTDEQRLSGRIVEIIRRAPMIGTFFLDGKKGFVRPIEKKVPYIFEVPMKSIARFGLAGGHRVVFSINKRARPEVRLEPCFVTEILGHINDPGVDVLTLVHQAGVPCEFSEEVAEEIAQIPQEIHANDLNGRLDLRAENIFTIDGDDTKDIDDAISFEKTTDGCFRLGVHIADVSHYVRAETAIDAAAFSRGTSIYLADRVIPMLPHAISSGICSLFPGVDRLTISCIMNVDANGDVTDYKITPSVIQSKRRYTYNEVQEIIDVGDDASINFMDELREILRNKREKRGALEFDLPEAKIRVDENGHVIAIEPYDRNNATGIIEEFMILCNETIASHYYAQKTPFVYRTHEEPSAEKLTALAAQLPSKSGKIPKSPRKINASALQILLETAKSTPAAYTVSTAILRALPQAAYTHTNPTHFGLASEAYCHFTSPIRRYADLQVHRIIKKRAKHAVDTEDTCQGRHILSKPGEVSLPIKKLTQPAASPEDLENLAGICLQCSRTERVAEVLEREVTELKKVQFMSDKEGQTFEAIVSGITSWGVFVVLKNTAEGLVPVSNLERHRYKFDKEQNLYEAKRRKGEKSGKVLRIGASVEVRLVRAIEDERRLIFYLGRDIS
ncbi:MAG: ribonuclease R [Defluviitaleaceae bacterium]|nr:ribonuclease R [Defluviitaleaceae bacterium]